MSIFNTPWWSVGAVIIALVVVVWVLWRTRREVSLADATVSLNELRDLLANIEFEDAKLKKDMRHLTARIARFKEIQAANMKEKGNEHN